MTDSPGQSPGGDASRDGDAPTTDSAAEQVRTPADVQRSPAADSAAQVRPPADSAAQVRPPADVERGAPQANPAPWSQGARGTAEGAGPVPTPASYGTPSFGPGAAASPVSTTGVTRTPPPVGGVGPTPGAGPQAAFGVRSATAATATTDDAGARDWRDQWRAARSGPDGAGQPGSVASTSDPTAPPTGTPPDPGRRTGGFRSALTAGLAQAKAIAAGSWSPQSPEEAAANSPMPGMRTDAQRASEDAAGADQSANGTSSTSPAATSAGRASTTGLSTGSGPAGTGPDARADGAAKPSAQGGRGSAVPAALAGGAVVAAVGAQAGTVSGSAGSRLASAATTVTPRPAGLDGSGTTPVSVPAGTPTRPAGSKTAAAARRPASPRGASRLRRAHLKLTRIDPWTIMKVSFMLSIAFGIMTLVAVAVVWSMLDAAGVFTSLDETVSSVTGEGGGALDFDLMSWVGFDRVMGFTTLIAVVDVVLITALATLAAFLYNLAASLLGGVEVTFVEDQP